MDFKTCEPNTFFFRFHFCFFVTFDTMPERQICLTRSRDFVTSRVISQVSESLANKDAQ